ncbi:O-antigen ligase family protein [Candidatus Gottesmanbacteria bacterium]|nr:O-antigen ligase family protein [Candidatus Gottesmanbacteria bacterium]
MLSSNQKGLKKHRTHFIEKIQFVLFFLLILFLPTQLGKFYFFPESFISGIRVDYLAAKIYLTDVIIFALLFNWLWSEKDKILKWLNLSLISYLLSLILIFISLFILLSQNKFASIYQSLKLLEYLGLAFYIIKTKPRLRLIFLPLTLAVVFESTLAILQWFKQASVGGPIYWLGERTFSASTPGIALMDISGTLKLRPYATFPHPNVLAGFLTLSLTTILFAIIKRPKTPGRWPASWRGLLPGGGVWILGTIALFLSTSLSAIFANLIGIVLIGLHRKSLILIFFALILIVLSFFVASPKLSSPQTSKDWKYRQELNLVALKMFQQNPLIGKGINNFLPQLPIYKSDVSQIYWWQPVHNIYLLILSETGIIGFSITIFILYKVYKNYKKVGLKSNKWLGFILLSQILLIGMIDHYFLTLQQGQIMATIVISLAFLPQNSYT